MYPRLDNLLDIKKAKFHKRIQYITKTEQQKAIYPVLLKSKSDSILTIKL